MAVPIFYSLYCYRRFPADMMNPNWELVKKIHAIDENHRLLLHVAPRNNSFERVNDLKGLGEVPTR